MNHDAPVKCSWCPRGITLLNLRTATLDYGWSATFPGKRLLLTNNRKKCNSMNHTYSRIYRLGSEKICYKN